MASSNATLRDAQMLCVLAERHMDADCVEEALQAAKEALTLFRNIGEFKGMADALRITVNALIAQDEQKKALSLARKNIAIFRAKGQAGCQAKMLLSIAEAGVRGSCHEALLDAQDSAKQAIELFVDEQDDIMEAHSWMTLCDIILKLSVTDKKKALEALDCAKKGLRIFERLEDTKGQAKAWQSLGTCSSNLQDLPGALEAAKRALDLYTGMGLKKEQAIVLHNIAQHTLTINKPQDAIPSCEQALALFQEIGCGKHLEGAALHTLVQAHQEAKTGQEVNVAKRAYLRYKEAGDRIAEGYSLDALVSGYLNQGLPELGLDAAEKAKECFREEGNSRAERIIQRKVAELQLQLQQPEKAIDTCSEVLRYFEENEDSREVALTLFTLCEAQMRSAKLEEAGQTALAAREASSKAEDRKVEAQALIFVCLCYANLGDIEKATAACVEAQEILKKSGERLHELRATKTLCEVLISSQEYEKVTPAALQMWSVAKEISNPIFEVTALIINAQARQRIIVKHAKNGDSVSPDYFMDTMRCAVDAVALARKTREQHLIATALCSVAEIYMMATKWEQALGAGIEAVRLFQNIHESTIEASAGLLCASAHLNLGEMNEAWEAGCAAVKVYQTLGDKVGENQALQLLEAIMQEEAPDEEVRQPATSPSKVRAEPEKASSSVDVKAQPKHDSADRPLDPAVMPTDNQSAEFRQAQPKKFKEVGAREAVDVRNLDQGSLRDTVVAKVRDVIQEYLEFEDDIHVDEPLMAMGITSQGAILMQQVIAKDFPTADIPQTLVFDYPTLQELSDFMVELIAS